MIGLGFSFSFEGSSVSIHLESTLYGFGFVLLFFAAMMFSSDSSYLVFNHGLVSSLTTFNA